MEAQKHRRRQPRRPATPIDVDFALGNILLLLQQDPSRYHLFGVHWWRVKTMLRARFGREQLYLLGDYVGQTAVSSSAPSAGDEQAVLAAAILEYRHNFSYPRSDGLVEDADGDLVLVYDPDAGL